MKSLRYKEPIQNVEVNLEKHVEIALGEVVEV